MVLTHGFELLREQDVPDINVKARLYRHAKSGAQLLSLITDDENKVFGIAFTTPPDDSSGLPHILEHSVLCGSRKYPVKEPFIELAKSSLNTFLNAMTYPDRTIYPVASQNTKDLYNLIDVYLDAVFYPNISRWTLMQEGWHYELEAPDQPLHYRGVVFNEMKGAYSSPDNVLGRVVQQTLLPDTVYGVDSGGDPEVIPTLTFEKFKAFHERYYHPSNARIFFYGNDDPEERLRYLDGWLSAFDRTDIHVEIPTQPRFAAPRRIVERYQPGEGEAAQKCFVTVNWLLTEETDPELTMALDILDHLLVGNTAAPLRKALIDSGLGENITASGIEGDVREAFFSVGLRGVAQENVDKVEALILDTVAQLARDGFNEEQIEASVNTLEFRLREANFGNFPRGIAYMIAALRTWTYGGDPLMPLMFEKPLQAIKDRLAKGEPVFTELLRRFFVENPHRTTVILMPDAHLGAEMEQRERARLDQARAAMSDADLQRVIAETHELERRQLTPDNPEDLAKIPTLTLSDLPRQVQSIPTDAESREGVTLLHHDLFTNGIVYLDLAFDLRHLPAHLVPFAGLIGRVLLQMGTAKEDFVQVIRRIGRKTGGISTGLLTAHSRTDNPDASRFTMHGKCTVAQFNDMLDILRDVLLTAKLDNRERFKQLVLENKASIEASLTASGHGYVNARLRSHFSPLGWFSEQAGGVSQLFFLRELAQRIENDWEGVLAQLHAVREALIRRNALVVNVTLDAANWDRLRDRLWDFVQALPDGASPTPAHWETADLPTHEALTVPAQVNYVGKGANLYDLGLKLHGSWLAVQNWLNTGYLWERVRMQGGAYGGFCTLDIRSGMFSYLSYRDPNLSATLANYDSVGAHLREHQPDSREVERTIIGVIGDMDAYMLPDAKGYTAMVRWLLGETDALRQQLRDEVLATTPADFVRFAEAADAVAAQGHIVVMGSQQAIEKAADIPPLTITPVL